MNEPLMVWRKSLQLQFLVGGYIREKKATSIGKILSMELTPFVWQFMENQRHKWFSEAKKWWFSLKLLVMQHIINQDIEKRKAKVGWIKKDDALFEKRLRAWEAANQGDNNWPKVGVNVMLQVVLHVIYILLQLGNN